MSTVYVVIAIRDTAMQRFTPPAFMPSVAYAVRSFNDEVQRKDGTDNLQKHPEDFELWHIADWAESNGQFHELEDGPRCIARGKDSATPRGV